MPERFVCWEARASDAAVRELACAAAFEAGASGCEEREAEALLLVYAPDAKARAVERALAGLAGAGLAVGAARVVEERDWSLAWREGLRPLEVSERLLVRPSFVELSPHPGRAELVIDPGQAFGTGGHASTRLALRLLDALPEREREGARVLDVGCGTGVLALAACRLGAATAVAFDCDRLAASACAHNARHNRLEARVRVFAGSTHALGPRATAAFDVVLANLLRREMEPLLGDVARILRPGGAAVLSGLLASERERILPHVVRAGLAVTRALEEPDPTGEVWLGLVAHRSEGGDGEAA